MKIIGYSTDMPMPMMMRFDLTHYAWYNEKFDGNLPGRYRYQRDQMNVTELWILMEDITLTLVLEDGSLIEMPFKKGFVWDLASVPEKLRSVIDNDAFIVFIAALFHDAVFGLHLFDFDTCNDMFRQLIVLTATQYGERLIEDYQQIADRMYDDDAEKYMKKCTKRIEKFVRQSERDSELYEFGVDSPFGKNVYEGKNPATHWNLGFVTKKEIPCKI